MYFCVFFFLCLSVQCSVFSVCVFLCGALFVLRWWVLVDLIQPRFLHSQESVHTGFPTVRATGGRLDE